MSLARLYKSLSQCLELLQSVNESFWSEKIKTILAQKDLAQSARGILDWYGGMGSFSDLIICRVNGHEITAANEPSINKKLSTLRTKIYEDANSLCRVQK